jgi:hypothetical protein
MVNKKNWWGILAMVLVFGMAVVGCDPESIGGNGNGGINNPTYTLNGTWYTYGNVQKYYFDNGDYELYYNANSYRKGTYTTTNDSMTMTVTHIGNYGLGSYAWLDQSTWYSRDEFVNAYVIYYRNYYRNQLQQTYDNYVSTYNNAGLNGTYYANQYFQSAYGSTDIDTILNQYYGTTLSQHENTINTTANSYYTTSTVAYSLSDKLILGGVTYTKE